MSGSEIFGKLFTPHCTSPFCLVRTLVTAQVKYPESPVCHLSLKQAGLFESRLMESPTVAPTSNSLLTGQFGTVRRKMMMRKRAEAARSSTNMPWCES